MSKMSIIETYNHRFNVLEYPSNWPYKMLGGFKDGKYHMLMERGVPIEDVEGEFDIDSPTRYEFETVLRAKGDTEEECINNFQEMLRKWELSNLSKK